MSRSSRMTAFMCGAALPLALVPATPIPSADATRTTDQAAAVVRSSMTSNSLTAPIEFTSMTSEVNSSSNAFAARRKNVAITASALPASATVGQASTIAGTVTAAAATRLRVQQRASGSTSWRTVRTITADRSGHYVFAWTPTSRRAQQFRVLQPAHHDWKAGVSRLLTVRVAAAPIEPHWRSVSLGFEDVVLDSNPAAQRAALRERLDAAHVNRVQLAAGRVEWTAFDWPAYPTVAADGGTDHLGQAIAELTPMANGARRSVALTIDALMPELLKAHPAWTGQSADGSRSHYLPSASALHDGPAGDRIVALARHLALTYRPDQIAITELVFGNETFGPDDRALYRRMTGANDWPRTAGGTIDTGAPAISAWRSAVLYDLLARVRRALDEVTPKVGHRVDLAQDVRVNWTRPAAGRPESGADYPLLGQATDELVLWAYFGTSGHTPADVRRLANALGTARFTVSVGMWAGANEKGVLSDADLLAALRAAAGAASLNVTPQSMLTAAHWRALAEAWPTWPH